MLRIIMINRFWCVIHFLTLLFIMNLTILRAHVIPDNVTYNVSDSYAYSNDTDSEDALDFLNGFVFEDSDNRQLLETMHKDRKKRSITSTLVPQYMMDLYEYLSDKKYKVTFDTARSYRSTGK